MLHILPYDIVKGNTLKKKMILWKKSMLLNSFGFCNNISEGILINNQHWFESRSTVCCLWEKVLTAFTSPLIESQSNYMKPGLQHRYKVSGYGTQAPHCTIQALFLALLSLLKEMLFCCVSGIWINYCIFCSLCSTN